MRHRAYAIQRRARVRIRDVTVQLPTVFESEEPRVLYGFVNLVVLFRAVDIHFIASWSSQMPDVCSEGWISSLQTQLDVSAPMLMESIETQKVDVAVSRLWLRILVWQIGVRHGLLSRGCCSQFMNLDYPVTLAGDLVRLISASGQQSWDSHGIGMVCKPRLHIRGAFLLTIVSLTGTKDLRYYALSDQCAQVHII